MKKSIIGVIAFAAAGTIAAVAWYRLQSVAPDTEQITQRLSVAARSVHAQSAPAQTAAPEHVNSAPPPIPAPNILDGSDAAVKSALGNLAPQLLQWFTPPEQIRRWVMFVDQIADGSIPADQRPLVYGVKPFQGLRRDDAFTIDKANFERATPLIDAIVAIPPERMMQYYRNWQPLFERAYRELGRGGSFNNRLRAALKRISAVRALPENAELNQAGVYFVFSDPNVEKASELEKLLWRMGPENSRRLQTYLSQLQQML